jgi:hypothetical protein
MRLGARRHGRRRGAKPTSSDELDAHKSIGSPLGSGHERSAEAVNPPQQRRKRAQDHLTSAFLKTSLGKDLRKSTPAQGPYAGFLGPLACG